MTRPRSWLPAALVAVALGSATAIAGQVETTQAASPITVDLDLGTVLPGTAVTRSVPVDVPEDALVTRSEWVVLDGLAREMVWDIQLCGPDGCRDVAPPRTGADVPTGKYDLTVTGALPAGLEGQGRAVGVVTLSAADAGGLAGTGGAVPWLTLALATGAIIAGAVAVTASLRTRRALPAERRP